MDFTSNFFFTTRVTRAFPDVLGGTEANASVEVSGERKTDEPVGPFTW